MLQPSYDTSNQGDDLVFSLDIFVHARKLVGLNRLRTGARH